MAVPAFLATTHGYASTAGVVDINTVLSDLRTHLTSVSWVETGVATNIYTSPTDAYGRFMRAGFVRTTATAMTITFYDQYLQAMNTRVINLDVAGNSVLYFFGSHHWMVQMVNSGTKQSAAQVMLIGDPEPFDQCALYVATRGHAVGSGGSAEVNTWANWSMMDNGIVATSSRTAFLSDASGNGRGSLTGAGNRIYFPVYCFGSWQGATRYINGVFPQIYMGPTSGTTPGATYTIPIDTATTATFMMTYYTSSNGFTLFIRAD